MDLFDIALLANHDRRRQNIADIRSRCFSAFLGENTLACRVLGRFTVLTDSRDRSHGLSLVMHGHWEIEVTELISRIVKPGMRVVDAGACWGYYSVLMAHLVGSTGSVVSVEPNGRAAELLVDTLRANGFRSRTAVHWCALGAAAGEASFVSRPGRYMNNHILRNGEAVRRPDTLMHLSETKVLTLDSLCEGGAIDFIKVDVEGSEADVVRGMPEILGRSPVLQLLLEFNAKRLEHPAAFLDLLNAHFPLMRALRSNQLCAIDQAQVLNSENDFMLYCSKQVPNWLAADL